MYPNDTFRKPRTLTGNKVKHLIQVVHITHHCVVSYQWIEQAPQFLIMKTGNFLRILCLKWSALLFCMISTCTFLLSYISFYIPSFIKTLQDFKTNDMRYGPMTETHNWRFNLYFPSLMINISNLQKESI